MSGQDSHRRLGNSEIADLLEEMAEILEIRQENAFRIRAYRRAAGELEDLAEDAVETLESGKVPGIGADLALKIREASRTGSDIEGDLHAHTDWSDGHHPLGDLIAAAEARGYEYIVVSDHSQSTTIARGLTPERVREQIRAIRALQKQHRIRILTGTECDILAEGELDFPDEILAELDVVVAAVHSRFKQTRAQMTARICRALQNPHVRVLAHPTGRRLGSRDPYDVDLEDVFAVARKNGKAVEINGSPLRLDLKDSHVRRARDLGLWLSIDTDTHYLSELDNIALGIATARRGWVGPGSVVNALPLARFLEWTRAGRENSTKPS